MRPALLIVNEQGSSRGPFGDKPRTMMPGFGTNCSGVGSVLLKRKYVINSGC